MATKRPLDDELPPAATKIQRIESPQQQHQHRPPSTQHAHHAQQHSHHTNNQAHAIAHSSSLANPHPHPHPHPHPYSHPHPHPHILHDFSGSVKRKLADSKRTGQACDRCKVRKIRCDGRPEGCTPCEQNRSPCRTTDRITGRATVRGHADAMEAENSHLRTHLADLEAQLRDLGAEPRPPPAYTAPPPPSHPWSSSSSASSHPTDAHTQPSPSPLPGYAPTTTPIKSEAQSLPHFKSGSIGDNYLGVAARDGLLSHIRGTSLSVFGTEIDITDHLTGEAEYEDSPMSYSTLIAILSGSQKVPKPDLPPYETLKEYAIWYLRSLNPFTMLVHKPVFLDLVWSFGNDATFNPTAAQVVTIHMMLATIQYQIATRNNQQTALAQESHAHYHYALSFYQQLLWQKHKWHAIQALAMICHHLRTFPKPGPAWMMTSMTYLYAIELGMHRSAKAWSAGQEDMTKLDVEMRKRIFWTLHALVVNLNGKLGRPMPSSIEDIDVEYPDPMNDCLPGEEAKLDADHHCSFHVGIQMAKYTTRELDLFKTMYAVRHSSHGYTENLKRLEANIQQWKDEIPVQLRDPAQASPDDHIFALYLEYWHQAYKLLLHHPAVCRSTDPAILSSNLEKCLDASQKLLRNCTAMLHKKSLDIPWINTVVYIAAAFTTLFVSSMRKDHMSPVDMTQLKDDMAAWTDVIGECDQFLGSAGKLKGAIAQIINQSLGTINDSIVKRTASESLARVAMQKPQPLAAPQSLPNPQTLATHNLASTSTVYNNNNNNNTNTNTNNNLYRDQYTTTPSGTTDPTLASHSTPYTSMNGAPSHSYNLETSASTSQQSVDAYDQQSYSVGEETGIPSSHVASLAAAASSSSSQPSTDAYAYAHTQTADHTHQPAYSIYGLTPQDWQSWGRTYTQQMSHPGEYLNTATTLMTLGREAAPLGSETQTLMDGSNVGIQVQHGHHWPTIQFSGSTNGHTG